MIERYVALLALHGLVALSAHVSSTAVNVSTPEVVEEEAKQTPVDAEPTNEPNAEEVEPETTEEPLPEAEEVASSIGWPWRDLADCESGNWLEGGGFEPGSARWGWGGPDPIPPWGTDVHDGGLQFHPKTWEAYRFAAHPGRAYDASPQEQVEVAELVLEAEGWDAWPTCSSLLGLKGEP